MSKPNAFAPELGAMSQQLQTWTEGRRTIQLWTCALCETPVEVRTKAQRAQARRKRVFCSDECRDQVVSASSSARMSRTNKHHASARMTANNPMHRDEVRQKMSATLQQIGHKPRVQGGNGRGLTEPQWRLMNAVSGLEPEYILKTGMKRGSGYPYHYKLDLAMPSVRLAVEVDGGSHQSLERRQQDAKKDNFLKSNGWTVLRFTNQEVMCNLEAVRQTVTSTISRLRETTTTSPTASWSITATTLWQAPGSTS